MKFVNENSKAALSNTAASLEMLKEWLSISESQICSTEVLSEQLPKINKLLEDSMNDISGHFSKLAARSQDVDRLLSHIEDVEDLPQEIGTKNIEIANYIEVIADKTSDMKTKENLEKLLKAINSQKDEVHGDLKEAHKIMAEIAGEISQIIVSMQFQDRVSQNIVITVNIMREIVNYLDKEIGNTLPTISREERKGLLDKEFAKKLLTEFRLGELQRSFLDHLIKQGYIESAAEIGFDDNIDHDKSADDDVELF